MRTLLSIVLGVLVAGCTTASQKKPDTRPQAAPAYDRVPRADFNRLALELALPLFWTDDANGSGALDPAELALFWGLSPQARLEDFAKGGAFTPAFQTAYERLAQRAARGPDFDLLTESERTRRKLVIEELAQGRQTLVHNDLRALPADEKRFVQNVRAAAVILDRLYEKQLGVAGLERQIPPNDTESRALFFRNHGFRCTAPRTQANPQCSAIPNPPTGLQSGLYPQSLLNTPNFCEALGKDDKALVDPFTVVVEGEGGKLQARPYTEVWSAELSEVSRLLKDAAEGFTEGREPALKAYLLAAAQAFLDNDWVPADEAWAKMNAQNSKWYLRIGPDEVYAEPCSTKAMFHVSFGLINSGSVKWQAMLDPLKAQMEQAIAKQVGAPYQARTVTFDLPDFMDVVLNAGDARNPSGATIGQSLPNFGPVANEGRGRTVAMVNLYTDPDSLAALEEAAEALFCPSVMPHYTTAPEPQLMDTLLHEAAHNLGPSHQYRVNGKDDRQTFGGPLASTMEELKAQTAALYFTDWLAERKVITHEDALRSHVRALQWAFGHISRGMYDEQKHPRTYSQLSAIQLGYLMQRGALAWKAGEAAANGKDPGCFAFDFQKLPGAIVGMMKDFGGIKARGDRKAAEQLIADHVDVTGERQQLFDTIAARVLRAPRASFVYSLPLE